MKLTELIEIVLREQDNQFNPIPVDITLSNGNILLRSFHIYEFDLSNKLIQGLTQQEEYTHAREGREPVYCFLKLEDIKGIECPDLGLEYGMERSMVRV